MAPMLNGDLLSMTGKAVLVTGCGNKGGIGAGIAAVFADAGADIVVTDVPSSPGLEAVAGESQGSSGRMIPVYADLTEESDIRKLVETVVKEFGRLDILINNAAAPHGTDKGDPASVSTKDLDGQLDVNVRGTFLIIRQCIPIMRNQRWGRIVNISSQAGRVGMKDRAVYSASKAAILGMTRSIAMDVAANGITVNAICPGPIETDRLRFTVANERKSVLGENAEELRSGLDRWASSIPVGRLGQPRDVGVAALFFASEAADFITAQTLGVDGGHFGV